MSAGKDFKMVYDLQKADVWKRISAFLFDLIIMFMTAVGFVFLLSLILNIESYSNQYRERKASFESEYGVSFDFESREEYDGLSEEEKANVDAAFLAFSSDEEANYAYTMIFQLLVISVTFGILIAFIILEFVIPLIFKNGQTLGKKIFGIGVMRIDGVKIDGPILFIRTVLGKYTIETMVPVLLVIMIIFEIVGFMGPIIILLIPLTNLVMVIATKTNSPIHDMLANTVTVDLASQMIFDTPEALLEYKQKIHAEAAERAQY